MDAAAQYAAHVDYLNETYGQAAVDAELDALVLHAGAPHPKDRFDDQFHPLRPTPAFAHWIPLLEPDACVIVRPGKRPTLYRPHHDDFWEAPPAPPPDWALAPFDVVHKHELPHGARAVISNGTPSWASDPELNPPGLLAALDRIRTRKTEHERSCIAAASRAAVRGHRRLAALFAAGDPSELALHLAYLDATGQDDVDTPYKNIVALGAHAAVLHFVSYDRTPPKTPATSLLVDAGAQHLGYASDITRTHVRGTGAGADLFRALVAAVERFQQILIGEIRPGLPYEKLHDRSHQLLAEALVELGIGRGSAEALVANGVTRALYPHGLGHSLGIQVHDVGMRLTPPRADNPFLRNTSTITPGQVFTIEPGVYVIDALVAKIDRSLIDAKALEAIRPFGGVRIEDDVAVLPDGVRDFTREAFAEATAAA